jgi:hypothetical protein
LGDERDDGVGPQQPPLAPRLVTADPRKFAEYVLDPSNAGGKDAIFVGMFGYRSRSEEDSRTLAATYVEQARTRLATGEYSVGRVDEHGQRYILSIDVQGRRLRSVWIWRPSGVFALVTPFSGFVRRRRREP